MRGAVKKSEEGGSGKHNHTVIEAKNACGHYCKNLLAKDQREIIQTKMMEENGCLINKANHGSIGEKKYLISATWWREWCDYVNFDLQLGGGQEIDYRNSPDFQLNNNLLKPHEIPQAQYFSVPVRKQQEFIQTKDNSAGKLVSVLFD